MWENSASQEKENSASPEKGNNKIEESASQEKENIFFFFPYTKCVCPNPLVILGNPTATLIVSHYLQSKNHICVLKHPCVPIVHMSNPTMYLTYIWYPIFCLHTQEMIYLLWQHQNPWQQHCHPANYICKQFWYNHNNYYIIMGNSTFKRTFQSHLDPDEI